MRRAAVAGIIAFVTLDASLVSAQERSDAGANLSAAASLASGLTMGRIAHIKAMLKLTPEQQRCWPPVEAALRDLAEGSRHPRPGRVVVAPAAVSQSKLQRLASAAMPLIMLLREDQKRKASAMARAMGLTSVASAF